MKDIMKLISPENLFIATGKEDLSNPIIEMSDKKNLLYTTAQSFNLSNFDYPSDLMMSIIYDVEKKTIEMRGRIRYHKSGNKTVFSDKKQIKYSIKELKILKGKINEVYDMVGKNLRMQPIDERTELVFDIGEKQESIIKKMNDSNRFNIAISSAPKKS